MAEMKDFTNRTGEPPRQFRIDDDVFTCAPVLPAGVARKFAAMAKAEPIEQFEQVAEALDMILEPASAERFAGRMTDPVNPISIQQIGQVVEWIMTEFGGRPTTPAGPSSVSQTNIGTSSTDGAPATVPTL